MSFNSLNWPITISIFLLLSIGILVIWSSSAQLAFQQTIFAVIGMIAYLFISQFDYRAIKNAIRPIYFFLILLLAVVLVIGLEIRGSTRWISIGFVNIQPSEFIKPALILFLADFWSKNKPTWGNIFKSLLWISLPVFLIFKQPDFGTTMTLGVIWTGMVFAAGISIKKIITLLMIFLLVVPMVWLNLHGYQKDRVTSFMSPEKDPLGVGYNLIQSTIAVGSGQILGRGLGQGTQSRLQFLPEFRTDFIFASIAEELGFLGSTLILGIYLFLIGYSLKVSIKISELFGFLIIIGAVSVLIFQITVNIGMNMGILPITGITLPLISYGGSSMIATLIILGLVASISRDNNRRNVDIMSVGG